MQKLHFSVFMRASRMKVWDTMLHDATYRVWTEVFNPGGSYYVGDWTEGGKILFLGPDKEGRLGGMVSVIEKNVPHAFMSIKHVGEIKDGVEDTTSDGVKGWSGALENYTFNDKDGGTELLIDIDIADEFEKYMNDTWPKALEKLKELCEKE